MQRTLIARGFFILACSMLVGAALTLNAQTSIFFVEGWESGSVANTFNSSTYGSAAGSQFRLQSAITATGTWALEHRVPAGDPGFIQYATQHFGDALTGPVYPARRGEHFYDLYIQYRVYYSPGFELANHPKQLIIGTQDDRRHENTCCNPWVAHYITIYPAGQGHMVAEANNKQAATGQWQGFYQNQSGYSATNLFVMQTGRWYTVEVRRRLNDSGVDNGIFQMWIDGVLISEHRTVRYRIPWNGTFGTSMLYGTNFAMISNYLFSSREQSVYYDDVKFSTSYIGSSATPPRPPTNVRVIR